MNDQIRCKCILIFSLTKKDNFQFKMKIDSNQQQHAFVCDFFGEGHDIYIANNANTTMESSSNLGDCFKHPEYAQSFLAGSYELDEIEVYSKRI
jgi:hypothetical protein